MKNHIQFLLADDAFLLSRHLNPLLSQIVDPHTKDFNFDRVSAATTPATRVIEILRTPPMMATSRTVVVDDFEIYSKNDLEEFLGYFVDPTPQVYCILIGVKLDKRTNFAKNLAKVGTIFEFKKPYPNQLPKFITDESQRLGFHLDPRAAQILVETVGTDLMTLIHEIEKLALYIFPEKTILQKHVEELSGQGFISHVWELGERLGQKDFKKALSLFKRMTEQGESVIPLLALVISHFRKLLLAKDHLMISKGSSVGLEKILGVPPFFVKDYERQANTFSTEELKTLYKKLMQVSEELRFSRVARDHLFENFLQEVCIAA